MSLIDTLTAVECEKLREERYNAQHPANAVWSEEELMWMDPAGIQAVAPVAAAVEAVVEAVVEAPVEAPVEAVVEAPVETPVEAPAAKAE